MLNSKQRRRAAPPASHPPCASLRPSLGLNSSPPRTIRFFFLPVYKKKKKKKKSVTFFTEQQSADRGVGFAAAAAGGWDKPRDCSGRIRKSAASIHIRAINMRADDGLKRAGSGGGNAHFGRTRSSGSHESLLLSKVSNLLELQIKTRATFFSCRGCMSTDFCRDVSPPDSPCCFIYYYYFLKHNVY